MNSNIQILNQTTSKGNQIKYEYNNKYYKIDTLGYESIAEVLVSELEQCIKGLNFVDYYLEQVNINDKIHTACVSNSFSKSDSYEVSVHRILSDYIKEKKLGMGYLSKFKGKQLADEVIRILNEVTDLETRDYIGRIVYLDAITLNCDRHLNNISFRLHLNGTYDFMPVYDNGASLLSDTTEFPMEERTVKLIDKVKAKPFSTSFKKQVEYFRSSVEPLSIDIEKFNSGIALVRNNLDYSVPFKQREFIRALYVLNSRLKSLEGIAWQRL